MSNQRSHVEEQEAINRVFKDQGVLAKAVKVFATPSFLLFAIRKHPQEKIDRVLSLGDEISLRLTIMRGPKTVARFQHPPILLEVPQRKPRPLAYPTDPSNRAHEALLGRGYGWGFAEDQVMSLEKSPHALVAGITGSGKSMLFQGLALSLAWKTDPRECRFILIDPKVRGLRPLQGLPHVLRFETEEAGINRTMEAIHAELRKRRSQDREDFRLCVFVDELAQLPKDALEYIKTFSALGRELRINVFAATQHPTGDMIGGRGNVVNFPTRIAGKVIDASAASVATGRTDTGAQFLPGEGAFLRIEGADIVRFQSFYLPDAKRYASAIARRGTVRDMPTIDFKGKSYALATTKPQEAPQAPQATQEGAPVQDQGQEELSPRDAEILSKLAPYLELWDASRDSWQHGSAGTIAQAFGFNASHRAWRDMSEDVSAIARRFHGQSRSQVAEILGNYAGKFPENSGISADLPEVEPQKRVSMENFRRARAS